MATGRMQHTEIQCLIRARDLKCINLMPTGCESPPWIWFFRIYRQSSSADLDNNSLISCCAFSISISISILPFSLNILRFFVCVRCQFSFLFQIKHQLYNQLTAFVVFTLQNSLYCKFVDVIWCRFYFCVSFFAVSVKQLIGCVCTDHFLFHAEFSFFLSLALSFRYIPFGMFAALHHPVGKWAHIVTAFALCSLSLYFSRAFFSAYFYHHFFPFFPIFLLCLSFYWHISCLLNCNTIECALIRACF